MTAGTTVRVFESDIDPPAEADRVLLYGKESAGVTRLYMRDSAGVITLVGVTNTVGAFALPEVWAQPNVPANTAATPMSPQVSGDHNSVKMTAAGSVVGLSTRLTEAVTAGTLTVTVTKNGSPMSLASLLGTGSTGTQVTQAPGVDTYVAGDLIGVQFATDAGFLPVTTDLEAWVQCSEAASAGGGGGGIEGITMQADGVPIPSPVTSIDIVGTGILLQDDGGGAVTIKVGQYERVGGIGGTDPPVPIDLTFDTHFIYNAGPSETVMNFTVANGAAEDDGKIIHFVNESQGGQRAVWVTPTSLQGGTKLSTDTNNASFSLVWSHDLGVWRILGTPYNFTLS